jgi:hypothetical protein
MIDVIFQVHMKVANRRQIVANWRHSKSLQFRAEKILLEGKTCNFVRNF